VAQIVADVFGLAPTAIGAAQISLPLTPERILEVLKRRGL
jgi:hypothetical protein